MTARRKKPGPPPPRPPRGNPTESVMADIQRLLGEREFASLDEVNAFLNQKLASGHVERRKPGTPLERAQDLIFRAWETPELKERIALAKQALAICADCADAYVLLAEETATSHMEAAKLYEKGVVAGERTLGLKTFTDDVGHFWGLTQTRPYMRARLGLAQALWAMGMHQPAINHFEAMLRLNDSDSQGVRYQLAALYAELGRDEELDGLLVRFNDDASAAWTWTRALWGFRNTEEATAMRILAVALAGNRHVPDYLLKRKPMPKQSPESMGRGDNDEAVAYVEEFGKPWRETPGALEWLAKAETGTSGMKRGWKKRGR